VKAILLEDAPPALADACARAGAEVIRARTAAEARALAAGGGFDLVDARATAALPLDVELQSRVDAFFARLRGQTGRGQRPRPTQPAAGLYAAVMREVERPLIAGALARARGVRAAAALALGIDRGTLARRMRALGLDRP
jgi:Fis family transcriptional regulator